MPSQVSHPLHGFAFSGYRSFVEPGTAFAPLGRVNLLAGQNNAGKSNVLRFLRDHLNSSPAAPSIEVDRPQDVLPQHWQMRLRLLVPDLQYHAASQDDPSTPAILKRLLEAMRTYPVMLRDAGHEFRYVLQESRQAAGGKITRNWAMEIEDYEGLITYLAERRVPVMAAASALTGQNFQSGPPQLFVHRILEALAPRIQDLPEVRVIQAFRQIRPRPEGDDADLGLFDGVGLVERLQQLAHPREFGAERDESREKFERINRFVRHILDDDSATLHIPFDANTVQVERGATVLPLDSLGTGVHQVVMLAATATLLSNTIVGLEEPEVHLHPLLQRRLVRYLASETDNQYFIATHSAHLLDYEAGRVFHLTYGAKGTEVAPAGSPHELAMVCADLGYRPSDLLQSNAVVWVEGPSDRIYIRRWIRDVAPELVEGIHFSMMFYGGGLLRHLDPEDPEHPGLAVEHHEEAIADFISLRRLNRHLAVVIDSDKTSARKRVNQTKDRVRKAFEDSDGPGHAWVTDCYTIENYVPRTLLEEAVEAVHPKWQMLPDDGIWSNPLRFEGGQKADKVAVARYVAERWPQDALRQLRLDRRINALVDLIRTANGHLT